MKSLLIRLAAVAIILPIVGCAATGQVATDAPDKAKGVLYYTAEACIARSISHNNSAIEGKNWCASHNNGAK